MMVVLITDMMCLCAQVDELDLTKPKATDLLKQHDGDAVKAMTAFIQVS